MNEPTESLEVFDSCRRNSRGSDFRGGLAGVSLASDLVFGSNLGWTKPRKETLSVALA